MLKTGREKKTEKIDLFSIYFIYKIHKTHFTKRNIHFSQSRHKWVILEEYPFVIEYMLRVPAEQ